MIASFLLRIPSVDRNDLLSIITCHQSLAGCLNVSPNSGKVKLQPES
jgi:hypothetical protein